jgi:hypothetical protein
MTPNTLYIPDLFDVQIELPACVKTLLIRNPKQVAT